MEQAQMPSSHGGRAGITATLALSLLLASLGTSIVNIALPALVEAFSAPFAQAQSVVVAYLATLTVMVLIAGHLGDRFGLKPMLVAGLALFLGASLLCAAAPDLRLLIAARAVQGVGAAFLMTLSMALMRQIAGEARVGRAMGLLGTVSALGTAAGPAVGGLVIAAAGWRGIFWLQAALAGLALLLALATLPEAPGRPQPHAPGRAALLVGPLWANLVVNLLVAAVMMTTLVVGPFYLGLGLGLTASLVGLVMSVGPALSILSGVPSGRLVDRWGWSRVLILGLALLAAGAFLLALLPAMVGLAGYVLGIVVLTPGYQLFQSANNTAALADVPGDRRGTVSGLLSLSRNIGLIVGASFMGAVFAFGVGTGDLAVAPPSAITDGLRLTFLLAGLMSMLALVVTLRGLVRRAAAPHPATTEPPAAGGYRR